MRDKTQFEPKIKTIFEENYISASLARAKYSISFAALKRQLESMDDSKREMEEAIEYLQNVLELLKIVPEDYHDDIVRFDPRSWKSILVDISPHGDVIKIEYSAEMISVDDDMSCVEKIERIIDGLREAIERQEEEKRKQLEFIRRLGEKGFLRVEV